MIFKVLPLALGALLCACPALAGDAIRHSGSIVSENTKHDTVTIAELGRWQGPTTRPVRRQFHLGPRTQVELAVRKNEPGAFKGEFAEQSMKVEDLRPGDYATVTVERAKGGREVVTKVEVVRPGR